MRHANTLCELHHETHRKGGAGGWILNQDPVSSLILIGGLWQINYPMLFTNTSTFILSLTHTHTQFPKNSSKLSDSVKKKPTTLKTLWCLHFGVCPAQIIRFCKSVTIVLYITLFVRNGVHSAWVPDWNRRGKRHAWRGPRFMLFMPCHRLSEPVTIHLHESIGE